MSDTSQGPGWWLASDGKWYPPQGPTVVAPKAGMSGCLKVGLIVGGIFVLLAILAIVAVTFLGATVADNVRGSVESGQVSELLKGRNFCANFTAVNDITKIGDADDPSALRARFASFDDRVDGFEASAPPEVAAEAATTAEVFRDIHRLLIDVDFDGSRITEDDLAAIFTPTRSVDVQAVSTHCGQ